MTRKCGTCNACCTWPKVDEIAKPAKTPCQHLGPLGYRCMIYEDQPETCAAYNCSWLRGLGYRKDQPNISGILMDRRMNDFGLVLVAKQLEPFAAMTKRAKEAIKRTSAQANMLCLIVDYENTDKVIGATGPDHLLQPYLAEMKAKQAPVSEAAHG